MWLRITDNFRSLVKVRNKLKLSLILRFIFNFLSIYPLEFYLGELKVYMFWVIKFLVYILGAIGNEYRIQVSVIF